MAAIVGSDRAAVPDELITGSVTVLTDGNRDREVFFGRASNNTSSVLSADAERRTGRSVDDYVSDPMAPETTRRGTGDLAGLTASSSASDANASLRLGPGFGPQAAVDGDQETAWVSGAYGSAVGEWIGSVRPTPATSQASPSRSRAFPGVCRRQERCGWTPIQGRRPRVSFPVSALNGSPYRWARRAPFGSRSQSQWKGSRRMAQPSPRSPCQHSTSGRDWSCRPVQGRDRRLCSPVEPTRGAGSAPGWWIVRSALARADARRSLKVACAGP